MPTTTGIVTKSTGSWYTVRAENGKLFECRMMGQFRIKGVNLKSTNPISVGDVVEIEQQTDGTGFIVNLHDRKNYIIRRSTKLSKQTHILAANVDHVYVLATLHHPRTSLGFIDRVLVTAEAYSIPASVVFNKKDLLDEQETDYVIALMELYTHLGYTCYLLSAENTTDVAALKKVLKGKVNLICGHSGVGKSTLINALSDDLHLKTGNISKAHNKGMHTTTFAEMHELGEKTYVIDTPGIKELGIVDMEKNELSHYFPEMKKLLGKCKYTGCLHDSEPHCAVRAAVDNSEIALTRYECYLQILNGEELLKDYDD